MRILHLGTMIGFASLFSFGGASTIIPQLQLAAVGQEHWLTERQFADCFAISQVTPGPNTLFVTLLGLQAAGVWGALVATVAVTLGPCAITFAAMRLWLRTGHARWHAALEHGLAPLGVGLLGASGLIVARVVDHNVLGWMVTACAAVTLVATKINPLWIIAAGALTGILAGGL